jgi:hypothetical protein
MSQPNREAYVWFRALDAKAVLFPPHSTVQKSLESRSLRAFPCLSPFVAILDTSEQPALQIGHTASGDYLAIPLAELGELIQLLSQYQIVTEIAGLI